MIGLYTLDQHRDALAHPYAHRAERQPAVSFLELMQRGRDQPGAGHAEGVTQRDRAAVWIDEIAILWQAELTQHGDALASEGFVELDHIDIRYSVTAYRQELAHGRNRADAHDARRDAGAGEAEDARPRLQAIPFRRGWRAE